MKFRILWNKYKLKRKQITFSENCNNFIVQYYLILLTQIFCLFLPSNVVITNQIRSLNLVHSAASLKIDRTSNNLSISLSIVLLYCLLSGVSTSFCILKPFRILFLFILFTYFLWCVLCQTCIFVLFFIVSTDLCLAAKFGGLLEHCFIKSYHFTSSQITVL